MKTNRLTLTFVSLMAVFAILITACTPAAVPTPEQVVVEKTVEVVVSPTPEPEGPVTITFWHAYNADVEAKFLDETLIPEFEAAHPNIKVESVLVPYDQFRRKLLISLSGGTAPDLARLDIIWVPELADQGALANLEETIPDFASYSEQFLPGPLSTNAVNPWIWSFGGDVTNADITKATGVYNGPDTVAAYQFLKDGVDKGYFHPGILGGGVDTWGAFGQDQIAMILEGPWFPPAFGGQFPDKKYGMALMPAGKGGSISVVGGEDIVLFQQSTHKEAAMEFMKFMLSEETQLKMVSTGQMPVLTSAIDSDTIKNHEFFGIFLEQLKTAKARTPHPNWSKIEEIMTNTGSSLV